MRREIVKSCRSCGQSFIASCGAARYCSDRCHFTDSYEVVNGCWSWARGRDKDGYGVVRLKGRRRVKAHRLSYEMHKGSAAGLMVCHSCDNPSCVNPDHLFVGSAQDNKDDSVRKDRHIKGERLHWKAKLTEGDVRAILKDDRPSPAVARDYNVSAVLIQMIRRREIWKHVHG